MADNVTLNAGSGGAVIRTDDDGTAQWQYVKVAYGADNTQNIVGSISSNPFPVALSNTDNAVLDSIAAGYSAEAGALGSGILIQGDDGTDRKNINVDATTGDVQVDVTNTVTVTGTGGTFPVTDSGGSLTVDNAALSVTGGGTEATALRVTLANDSTGVVSIDDNGGAITVDNGGTFAVQAAQSGTWNITNISGTVSLPTGAATAANQSTGNTSLSNIQTAVQLIDNPIVAHDAAVSGSTGVNMLGARATNSVEGITQVANADATRVQADLNGVLLSRPHTTLEEIITERVSDTGGTSTAFTNFAAGGAGIHNYITTISIYNSSSTDGYVDFRDGAGGAIVFTAPAPQTGGSVINLPVPIKFAANTAVAYDVSGALSTVYISVIGFQAQG